MSNSQKIALGLVLCLPFALGSVLLAVNAIFVPPTTIIEVGDGNTVPEGSLNCDWDTLNGATPTNNMTNPAAPCAGDSATINAYVFLTGDSNEKVFRGGGSKDPSDVPSWKWAVSSAPDKDTLTNGYAISYSAPASDGTHKILAFGAERFAVNGDANIGAWFFQKSVAPNAANGFDGVHTTGDVFAVSAFTNGGGHPALDVYSWDPACSASNYPPATVGNCAATNLRLLFTGTGSGLCDSTGAGADAGCASVNGTTITPKWPYATKFGGGTTVPVNGFFEGGFDLTAIFPAGANIPCFSSFLIDTRSSQSPTAVLKDFLSGSFPECGIDLTKSCACTSFHADGTGYDYQMSGTVTVKGFMYGVTVTDQGRTFDCGDMTGTKNWGAGAAAPSCTLVGGGTATFSSATYPTDNQATASGFTNAAKTGAPLTKTTDVLSCSAQIPSGACIPNPILTVDKACVTTLQAQSGYVVVRVDYTGQVHNGGNVNLNNVQVVDTATGTPATATFNVGTLTKVGTLGADKCYTNNAATCPSLTVPAVNSNPISGVASYFPSAATAVLPGRASFTDSVRATGTDAVLGQSVQSHPAGSGLSATCQICPFGVCPSQ